ncbi:P-loop containing nucleoside triphosphate hydrolase protein [Glonium stellatum]|uniref:P-loop containing nucleoside triphosphate hydrolase protein n=1 Tax=Glonium stellatum TaxID=574774 RepID=A0A8E2F6E0_9PEZI|nr:P-loop containing nucleoside triphosphate hydrolase protein [Glonium stellatum]
MKDELAYTRAPQSVLELSSAAALPAAGDSKEPNHASDAVIAQIMSLVGLEEVKSHLLDIQSCLRIFKCQGASRRRYHVVFQGNPGTGKTTVARLYAKLLHSVGVLESDVLKETSGTELASQGPHAVKEMIKKMIGESGHGSSDSSDSDILPWRSRRPRRRSQRAGGVLFVDEAYQLTAPHVSNAGRQVLDILLTEMENNNDKLVVVFAGYKEELESFFSHNPGLKSRIPNTLSFKDFGETELLKILQDCIINNFHGRMKVEGGLDGLYMRVATRRVARSRGNRGFGNARAVENLFDQIWLRQVRRLKSHPKDEPEPDYFYLTKEDLIGPNPSHVKRQSEALAKLENFTGLNAVKESVKNMFDMIETNYERELMECEPLIFSLNRVFVGSPGTGKTTVAKLYGQILADLGFLSNGDVVVKCPADFIGDAAGKSEANTKAILASTIGKVLIIDEAYMLDPGDYTKQQESFKNAVLDTLVAEVQSVPGDDRCVILLGYEDKLQAMFENANQGLHGRFVADNPFRFEDFSLAQLQRILEGKMHEKHLHHAPGALEAAADVLARAQMRQNFSNGREVDNILAKAILNFQARQSKMDRKDRRFDAMLEPEDFDPDFHRSIQAATRCGHILKGLLSDSIISKLGDYQRQADVAREWRLNPRELVPSTFLFLGASGTGKTTAARYMGKLFYDIGFLPTDEVVECSAADFIGQHVGHTFPKTDAQFKHGLGKVLFVDEAYRLMEGGYAAEAIEELISLIRRYSDQMILILAGDTLKMDKLMSAWPDLSSLFLEEIIFPNLKPMDCLVLLERELQRKSISSTFLTDPHSPSHNQFLKAFAILSAFPCWSNAKDVRGLAYQMASTVLSRAPRNSHGAPQLSLSADQAMTCIKTMFNVRYARLKGRNPPACSRAGQEDSDITKAAMDAVASDGNFSFHQSEQTRIAEVVDHSTSIQVASETATGEEEEHHDCDEQRVKEQAVQEALRQMAPCENGYVWTKEPGGYRCRGGAHFVSDASVAHLTA